MQEEFSPATRYDMILLFLNCLGTGPCLYCDNKIAHYCNLDIQIIKLVSAFKCCRMSHCFTLVLWWTQSKRNGDWQTNSHETILAAYDYWWYPSSCDLCFQPWSCLQFESQGPDSKWYIGTTLYVYIWKCH